MRDSNQPSQNRAEDIRRRRAQRSQQHVGNVVSRVSSPVQSRPVLVRGSGYGTPVHRQAGTRARRQFYVTMESSGAELRLPSLPLIRPGWRLLSGLLVVFLAVGIFSLWNSPFFRISSIDVEGLQRLNASDLEAEIALENLSVIEVNPQTVQAKIEQSFPELTDIAITVELPNIVTVTARERQPVLAWQEGDQTSWVDVEGFIFQPRGEAGALVTVQSNDNIPLAPLTASEITQDSASTDPSADPAGVLKEASILSGSNAALPHRLANLQLLSATLQLVKKLPEGTALVYDQANGLGWNTAEGYQVFIGKDLKNFDEKYTMYQVILQQLQDQGIQPSLISVEHLNAPFYRLEQ